MFIQALLAITVVVFYTMQITLLATYVGYGLLAISLFFVTKGEIPRKMSLYALFVSVPIGIFLPVHLDYFGNLSVSFAMGYIVVWALTYLLPAGFLGIKNEFKGFK